MAALALGPSSADLPSTSGAGLEAEQSGSDLEPIWDGTVPTTTQRRPKNTYLVWKIRSVFSEIHSVG